MDIYEGETLGVVGESGCGKSTLGRVLLQLYPPTEGSVIYYRDGSEEGIDLTLLPPQRLRELRRELQIIFQDPYSSLNPRFTVGEIMATMTILEIKGLTVTLPGGLYSRK